MPHPLAQAQQLLTGLAHYLGADRLYRLEGAALPADCTVERWQGWEQLALGYEWWVDVLSSDSTWPLQALLGTAATLTTQLADGRPCTRSGVIREAACVGGDAGLVRYRLCLVPWTWWLTQGRHSRVFQDKTVVEIVEAVFADYAPLAQWRLADEVGPFVAQAHPRSYCVQYRESDGAFVSRLLAEEGLGWFWEEDASAPAGHRWVLFADSTVQPEDTLSQHAGGIRFHRDDATEAQDTIQALGRQRRLGAAQLTVLGSEYRTVQALTAQQPLAEAEVPAWGEVYDPAGAYAFANPTQAQRLAHLLGQARVAQQQRWQGQSGARSFRVGTAFHVIDAPHDASGCVEFLLLALRHAGRNNLPETVREGLVDLLGPAPDWPALPDTLPLDTLGALQAHADAHGYANAFHALPRSLPWRPILADETGARLNPRPTAPGYQSAIVVADAGASAVLSSDPAGRIKVKFHWQHTGGAGTAERSCWLRVAQRYAGPGVGAQFLPRVGQEVLVTFLEGDIDRPLVVGALYNGQGEGGITPTPGGHGSQANPAALFAQATDHAPSAQANLAGGHAPPWHGAAPGDPAHRNASALWGIQSQEWGGTGYNRLLFDDSDGQLRLQLATTHAATQLNLGHLIHQADNYRGSFRGEGFELRSDAWGVLRAEAGLWLSAYPADAPTPAGDAVGPTALLTQAQTVAATFSPLAGTHWTVKLAGHEGIAAKKSLLLQDQAPLKALLTSAKTTVPGSDYPTAIDQAAQHSPAAGEGRVPHSGDPILGLAAPGGIAHIAGQSLHWAAGETLTLGSGQATQFAVAANLRLHTGQAIGWLSEAAQGAPTEANALSMVTGEGELRLQAQHDAIALQARDPLTVVSANAQLELAAGKTLHMATAGGASLTLEGGNITFACPGKLTVHASKKSFVGPAHLSREMNAWADPGFDQHVKLVTRSGKPASNQRYEIHRADGAIIRGTTDASGWTQLQKGINMDDVKIKWLGKA